MDFTADQRAAIVTPGHLVVTAGAGSGKTRVLVERYLRLVDEVAASAPPGDDPFAAVLAVTFTEKAAREMRDRVRRAAAARARLAPPEAAAAAQAYAAAAEAARIGTIHSFCAELLRAQPAESGLDPRFAILDEVEAGALAAASVEEALTAAATAGALPAALLEEFAPAELAEALGEL
ncbi:MAG TPA: UvrD-helicase domain-containing protein, partial [Chloroflexaceae bacterium]|nr:UvrD-helicase domain-containing protein [Chloroflexaceae bacterium]